VIDSLACQLLDAVQTWRLIQVMHPKRPIGPAAQALITFVTDEI
jgi:hypothetical protein